jgi:hypothetical protein
MIKINIKTTCPCCKHDNFVEVNKSDYENWKNGKYIQNAFPYLSAGEREQLITGICPKCWDTIFGNYD